MVAATAAPVVVMSAAAAATTSSPSPSAAVVTVAAPVVLVVVAVAAVAVLLVAAGARLVGVALISATAVHVGRMMPIGGVIVLPRAAAAAAGMSTCRRVLGEAAVYLLELLHVELPHHVVHHDVLLEIIGR